MQRVFIMGCGYTGAALARRLERTGVAVAGTSRVGGGARPALAAVDLTEPSRALELPDADGAVVYYMVPTLARTLEGRAHLAPMERALSALSDRAVQGLIYLSSTSVYGDRQGGQVDEDTPAAPGSPWGHMRLELEQLAAEYGRRGGVPVSVVRLPEIYGPGRGPVARLRKGYVMRFPDRISNRIHIEDLVTVLVRLGDTLEPRVLLACDDAPSTTREVYAYAARKMGLGPVPEADQASGDENRLALLRHSKRCCNAKLRAWLPDPMRYPSYREGISAILAAEGKKPTR